MPSVLAGLLALLKELYVWLLVLGGWLLECAWYLHGVAVWDLRVYGILAITHILLQYGFALSYRQRLYREEKRAARKRGVIGIKPVRHRRSWPASLFSRGAAIQRAKELEHAESQPALNTLPVPDCGVVWVTVFQEDPKLMRGCLQSLTTQDFEGDLRFVVSDDGSYLAQIAKYSAPQPEPSRKRRFLGLLPVRKPVDYEERRAYYVRKRRELLRVFDGFRSNSRFEFILSDRNEGKREAQQKAWRVSHSWVVRTVHGAESIYRRVHPKLYFSVDSDTVLDPDALRRLAHNFTNPDVAAATGYVDVRNAKVNLLTRLIDQRYWHAFNVERAAQSWHRAVMCCSGPLAAYRADVIDQVMGSYVTQRFLNKFCTFGDDRHLTNKILARGYLVVMDPRAHCLTEVPTTLRQYIKQQTRWNKSFYREMLWTTSAILSHSWYMTYDLSMQFLLPFLLITALVSTVIIAVTGGGLLTVLLYLATIVGIGFVRSLYGVIARRRLSYLLFVLYGPVYVCVLMPVRLYALVTLLLGRTHWGTREA